jgi:hypothetical protein
VTPNSYEACGQHRPRHTAPGLRTCPLQRIRPDSGEGLVISVRAKTTPKWELIPRFLWLGGGKVPSRAMYISLAFPSQFGYIHHHLPAQTGPSSLSPVAFDLRTYLPLSKLTPFRPLGYCFGEHELIHGPPASVRLTSYRPVASNVLRSQHTFAVLLPRDGSLANDIQWKRCDGTFGKALSACCVESEGDVCLDNGICYWTGHYKYRPPCSDWTWQDPTCAVDVFKGRELVLVPRRDQVESAVFLMPCSSEQTNSAALSSPPR